MLKEKDLKTHQQRRIALDAETIEVLTDHWVRCRNRAESLGFSLPATGYVFSLEPDASYGQRHLEAVMNG